MQSGNLFSDFISLFYPHYCFGCRQSMVKGEEILCTHCIFDLPKTNYHKLEMSPIKERLFGRLNLVHAFAFLKFKKEGIVQHLLHELKYNNHPEVGIKLGKLYGKELIENGINTFDLIVPVPLHESRKRTRGYNQSSKFAQGLSESLNIAWDESISMRTSSTATQTRKSRADRWKNVKDVFSLRHSEHVAGKRILLVDDVITTGATLEACGQHLIDSGCSLSIACIAEA
jgi:ComF family protein